MINGANLLIRADASPATGMVHIGRSLKLGRAWRKLGGNVTLVCGDLPGRLERQLTNERFRTWALACPDRGLIDAKETGEIARRVAADWIVVDGPRFDQRYREHLPKADAGLLAFVEPDVPNPNSPTTFVASDSPTSGKFQNILSGHRFRIHSQEFSLRPQDVTVPREARRLLLWLKDETCVERISRIVECILNVCRPRTSLDIVVPSALHETDRLVELKKSTNTHLRFHRSAKRVLASAAQIDLAITDFGGHNHRLVANGFPVAVLERPHGRSNTHAEPACAALKWVESPLNGQTTAFKTTIRRLIRDRGQRESMSASGRSSVDQQAPHRICRHMLAQGMTIRPAEVDDWSTVWSWNRDAETRSVAFESCGRDASQFQQRFAESLRDHDQSLLLARDRQERPVAGIRICTDADPNNAIVKVLVDPALRSRGIGTALLEQAIGQLFRQSTFEQITVQHRAGNFAAERSATNAGLTPIAPAIINQHVAHQFAIHRHQIMGAVPQQELAIRRSA